MAEKRKYTRYVTKEKLEQVNEKNKTLIQKYFNAKNMNLSDASKKSYESDFNQWLVFILERYDNRYILDLMYTENRRGEEVEDPQEMADLIEDFIAFCVSVLGNNERRIQRRLSSISSFFLHLRKKRLIKENPIDFIERPKIGKGEKPQVKQTFLTSAQVKTIRQKLKKLGDLQLELFFEFGLSTMARANAIANVKVNQIDFKTGRVNDVLEKEGYIVTLFPSKRTMDLIKQWLDYRKKQGIDNEYLFIAKNGKEWNGVKKGTLQSSWIKRIGNLINIPDLHCHDLRHSGANLLYNEKGMSLEDVSELLNHKGTQVTKDHYILTNYDKIQDKKAKFDI